MSRYYLQSSVSKASELEGFAGLSGVVDVYYGFDHALGYWVDVFLPEAEADFGPVVEISSLIDRKSNGFFIEALQALGAPEEHLTALMLDLPF